MEITYFQTIQELGMELSIVVPNSVLSTVEESGKTKIQKSITKIC